MCFIKSCGSGFAYTLSMKQILGFLLIMGLALSWIGCQRPLSLMVKGSEVKAAQKTAHKISPKVGFQAPRTSLQKIQLEELSLTLSQLNQVYRQGWRVARGGMSFNTINSFSILETWVQKLVALKELKKGTHISGEFLVSKDSRKNCINAYITNNLVGKIKSIDFFINPNCQSSNKTKLGVIDFVGQSQLEIKFYFAEWNDILEMGAIASFNKMGICRVNFGNVGVLEKALCQDLGQKASAKETYLFNQFDYVRGNRDLLEMKGVIYELLEEGREIKVSVPIIGDIKVQETVLKAPPQINRGQAVLSNNTIPKAPETTRQQVQNSDLQAPEVNDDYNYQQEQQSVSRDFTDRASAGNAEANQRPATAVPNSRKSQKNSQTQKQSDQEIEQNPVSYEEDQEIEQEQLNNEEQQEVQAYEEDSYSDEVEEPIYQPDTVPMSN